MKWTKEQETQSEDKRWNVEGQTAKLFKRNVEDLMGVNLIVRF